MILTYKIKHHRNFDEELAKAFAIAEFAIQNPKCRSSKDVKHIGLKSMISNQILKKYGRSKTIKQVHSVPLIIPNQGIKFDPITKIINIVPLKLHIPYHFYNPVKINQIEIDKTYAYVSVTIPTTPLRKTDAYIGIDRNTTGHIVVTANPDTGKIEKFGKQAIHTHKKYSNNRKRLQKQGKYRQVKRLRNRESRVVKNINHEVSRKIVKMAVEQNATIVFEDLSGIRTTKKQAKSFKYSLHSWSFYQLQQYVEYKANMFGIPVVYIDPAYTSQDCSKCNNRGKRTGKLFKCPICGHVDHADVNAAFNIAYRQKNMVDRMQKEMCTMGALIPHDAMLEC
ncbi:MAG: transposase [Methanocalculus sp.]|uniref:RNA-guided endonuclease InsQ/TnpB family protein n=1 Tax=Methanocalculus sp. TaxID=2004547 RepID=UPI002725B59E|nr:transposase [Methanocalculus sp.]MDO9540088.1 transposase [Methanocalculus sp.]